MRRIRVKGTHRTPDSLAHLAGAPLHTLDLCRGFQRAGHEVSVFTMHAGAVSATLESEGFPVYSLQDYRRLGAKSFDLVYLSGLGV